MNITFIDADPILWKGDANMRLIDLAKVVKKIHKENKQDVIYLIGGFDERNLFREYLASVIKELADLPVKAVSTYSRLEEKNIANIGVINLFYQSLIAQDNVDDNTYTIVAGDCNFFNMARFLQKLGGKPVKFVLTNDIPQLNTISENFSVIDTIDVDPKNLSLYDKITAKEVLGIVKSAVKKGRFETISNILYKCERFSNIARPTTLFITHSLIHGGYLKREVKQLESGAKKSIIVVGNKDKVEKLEAVL